MKDVNQSELWVSETTAKIASFSVVTGAQIMSGFCVSYWKFTEVAASCASYHWLYCITSDLNKSTIIIKHKQNVFKVNDKRV